MENNKKHILIVDDDNRIRDLLRDYLSENNYIVSTAENADQAKIRLDFKIWYHNFRRNDADKMGMILQEK